MIPTTTPNEDERAFFRDSYREAIGIVHDISPLLADRGQFVQGVTMALLVTKWICGHHAITGGQDTLQVRQQMLDLFIEAMRSIAREVEETPELVKTAPHSTRVSRLDEVGAARKPVLRWRA